MGVFGGPSSSDGAFSLHLTSISEEPDLSQSDVFGLASSRGKQRLEEEQERARCPGRRVPGKERRRQPKRDLQERWTAGTGEPSSKSHPFCTFELEAGLRQACFFLGGGRLVKKPHRSVMESECEG